MFHISNGKLSLPVCSCGLRHRKSNTHSSLAFLHHRIPLTYPLPPPHLFIYFFTSFTPLSVWSTFPFHPSSSSFSPEKVDLWLSLLRLLSASRSSPGTKGSRNATMSLNSACAQMRAHEKRLTFNHRREKAGIQLRMDGWMEADKGDEDEGEEEDGGSCCNWLC